MPPSKKSIISIRNAAVHNLKNISLDIPRNTFTVFTGISGSGKSSLAYDTIFKEGQRRYLASMSSYARQFLNQVERPEVDLIEGLSPTISIDQKSAGRNPRSTVGTITEVYDFLRLLFSRLGIPECPNGHGKIEGQTPEVIIEHIITDFKNNSIFIFAPIVQERKGEYRKELSLLREQGFSRAKIDGEIKKLSENITLERYEKHTIEVAFDYFELNDKNHSRLDEAVHKVLDYAKGILSVQVYDKEKNKLGLYKIYTKNNACPTCGLSIPELEPRFFSFNSPQGWCRDCLGLGYYKSFVPERLVKNASATIFSGAIHTLNENGNVIYTSWGRNEIKRIAKKWKINLRNSWKNLPEEFQERVLCGKHQSVDGIDFSIITSLEYLGSKYNMSVLEKYLDIIPCPTCDGNKLNSLALNVKVQNQRIRDIEKLSVKKLVEYFNQFVLESREKLIGEPILKEIRERLRFLSSVGLDYLTLDRRANSLSGGESQRIRLASQVGSGLEGCLYILDEPSIGLHQADNKRLIETLKHLRDKSNTVYVIEHDEETILSADHVVDIGPGAGSEGGKVLFNDSPKNFHAHIDKKKTSQTIEFLCGQKTGESFGNRDINWEKSIHILGAKKHNLKDINLKIPMGVLTVVCGVSGSGKSTLISDILQNALSNSLGHLGNKLKKDDVSQVKMTGDWDKFIEIDQKPIGRTPRSNPATYTKAFDTIRDLFAMLPEAKFRGYKKGRFSFNVKGGRCEHCNGAGVIEIDMQLFSSNEVVCETCNGRRFNQNTLDIHYKGKNIFDVLNFSVEEASAFFKDIPRLNEMLSIMESIGLGYIKLGQPSTTLSGGEAQRIKLSSELGKRSTGKTIYLLDEPTTGLHFEDIFKLLGALNRLVDKSNTVIIIEHNLDVIKGADFLVEMGPHGGQGGGELLFTGPPEELAKRETPTGRELKHFLSRDKKRKDGFYLNKDNFNTLISSDLKIMHEESKKGQKNDSQSKGNKGFENVENKSICIEGLKKNNLKNISLTLPKNKLIAVTGPSGSGKTSLAFDTIFQEGQRKYIESLSTYARRFLGRLPRADADRITGISPSIAVDQRTGSKNPRSTLATYTEIHDSLRVLYANIGLVHCPFSGKIIRGYTPSEAATKISSHRGEQMTLLAPLWVDHIKMHFILDSSQKLVDFIDVLLTKGYLRVFIDGRILHLEKEKESIIKMLGSNPRGLDVYVVIDRLIVSEKETARLIEGIEKGYDIGEGIIALWDERKLTAYASFPLQFETGFALRDNITPKHFSFNHHAGSCSQCQGIGLSRSFDEDIFIADPNQPLCGGAIKKEINSFFNRPGQIYGRLLKRYAWNSGIDISMPWNHLPSEDRDYLLYGASQEDVKKSDYSSYDKKWGGIVAVLEKQLSQTESDKWREKIGKCFRLTTCSRCQGGRLDTKVLSVRLADKNIAEISRLSISEAKKFFEGFTKTLSSTQKKMVEEVLEEIKFRLHHLNDLGLHYLTLDRTMGSLSGGEVQRLRLSTQIGNKLNDVVYVLDEPTIGLHERDTHKLLNSLKMLRDRGNTVILVEHDSEVIKASDYLVDMGPRAGHEGGEIMYCGENRKENIEHSSVHTYLYGEKQKHNYRITKNSFPSSSPKLVLTGINRHNLKNIDVKFPLLSLVGISGVSGSGKSSLIEVLLQRVTKYLYYPRTPSHANINFWDGKTYQNGIPFSSVVVMDQSPVSTSSRSTVSSYLEIFDYIRAIFASSKLSKERGFSEGHFSFNSPKGYCPQCQGKGIEDIEMHFISDVSLVCESCKGKRYRPAVLEIYYKGKTISDVLNLTVREAYTFFDGIKKVQSRLKILLDTGLGYLKLGLGTSTLSGGELQRIKLSKELAKSNENAGNLYVLDEPTTGLHFQDIEMLIKVIDILVKKGNTFVVIEHNREFLKNCDYLIDLGPEGGPAGGYVVAEGSLSEVKKLAKGFTHQYL